MGELFVKVWSGGALAGSPYTIVNGTAGDIVCDFATVSCVAERKPIIKPLAKGSIILLILAC